MPSKCAQLRLTGELGLYKIAHQARKEIMQLRSSELRLFTLTRAKRENFKCQFAADRTERHSTMNCGLRYHRYTQRNPAF